MSQIIYYNGDKILGKIASNGYGQGSTFSIYDKALAKLLEEYTKGVRDESVLIEREGKYFSLNVFLNTLGREYVVINIEIINFEPH